MNADNTLTIRRSAAAVIFLAAIIVLGGCENLPGTREEQVTAAGTAAGAAVGASVADNKLLGALLGGALGAAGGYLIGARTDWFEEDPEYRSAEAREAVEEAQERPATAEDVAGADDGDLNDDGFVTMDELVAMEDAGLGDDEILEMLERTDQVFELSESQRAELRDAGLSRDLLADMEEINREERESVLARSDVIGQPR